MQIKAKLFFKLDILCIIIKLTQIQSITNYLPLMFNRPTGPTRSAESCESVIKVLGLGPQGQWLYRSLLLNRTVCLFNQQSDSHTVTRSHNLTILYRQKFLIFKTSLIYNTLANNWNIFTIQVPYFCIFKDTFSVVCCVWMHKNFKEHSKQDGLVHVLPIKISRLWKT